MQSVQSACAALKMPGLLLTRDAFPAAKPGQGRAHCQSAPWRRKTVRMSVCRVWCCNSCQEKPNWLDSYALNMTKLGSGHFSPRCVCDSSLRKRRSPAYVNRHRRRIEHMQEQPPRHTQHGPSSQRPSRSAFWGWFQCRVATVATVDFCAGSTA